MSSHVEQIKERLSIADVAGSYIKLEKSGGNFKARCPFHNEKTPSFYISPARNSYYCFGCGAKGDIFSFVQEFEGLDFMGALKILAQRAGVELTKERPEARSERDRLFRCMESAAIFFQKTLYENADGKYKAVVEYLLKRGLTKETIKEWRIGFAPAEWRSVSTYLKGKGFTETDMEKAGLIKRKERDDESSQASIEGNFYDRFRGRIMFPLFDSSARVIAFSGRIFEDDGKSAKYLNSPETELFHKSEVLYGFHKAKQTIREKDAAVLVEGQVDLIMAHQVGTGNAVAVSGTALTETHLDRVRKLAKTLILSFDPDGAGVKAAFRSAEMALGMGLEVKVAQLPTDDDPADLIKENPEAWKKALENAVHIIEFATDHVVATVPDMRQRSKEILTKVLPFVARLESTMEKSHFIALIHKKSQVKEEAIWQDLRSLEANQKANPANPFPQYQDSKKTVSVERMLAAILFWQQSTPTQAVDPQSIKSSIDAISEPGYSEKILARYAPHKDDLILEAEVAYDKSEHLPIIVKELCERFQEEYLRDRQMAIMAEMSRAEQSRDEKRKKDLLDEFNRISKMKDTLSKRQP